MDRFIALIVTPRHLPAAYLKSNMDRFIETIVQLKRRCQINLKSNMDRFIVISDNPVLSSLLFKIQYG